MTLQDINALAVNVISRAAAKGLKIATAESCTGGGIGQALTSVSGSSAAFQGGIITYSNQAKIDLLGVTPVMILRAGAVSADVARVMAEGARQKLGADIAISATGIAGPTGGSAEKPVGLVYLGLSKEGAETTSKELRLGAIGREAVREETIRQALLILQEAMIET